MSEMEKQEQRPNYCGDCFWGVPCAHSDQSLTEGYRAAVPASLAVPPPAAQPDDDSETLKLIDERDAMESRLTTLANAVGEYFNVPVGEWSNVNAPDQVALEILAGGYKTDRWVSQPAHREGGVPESREESR